MLWRTFLAAHWGAIAAADFFTTEIWTARGLVTYYTLYLASRRMQIVGQGRPTLKARSVVSLIAREARHLWAIIAPFARVRERRLAVKAPCSDGPRPPNGHLPRAIALPMPIARPVEATRYAPMNKSNSMRHSRISRWCIRRKHQLPVTLCYAINIGCQIGARWTGAGLFAAADG